MPKDHEPTPHDDLLLDGPCYSKETHECPNCGEQDFAEVLNSNKCKFECLNCNYYEEN